MIHTTRKMGNEYDRLNLLFVHIAADLREIEISSYSNSSGTNFQVSIDCDNLCSPLRKNGAIDVYAQIKRAVQRGANEAVYPFGQRSLGELEGRLSSEFIHLTTLLTKTSASLPLSALSTARNGKGSASRLRDDHIRVREASGQHVRRQIAVRAQKPADILGIYVYLPGARGTAA